MFRSCAEIQTGCGRDRIPGTAVSYGELLGRVDSQTAMLAALGLRRGDRVALLSHNRPEYFEVELAAANLGVMTACLNWRLSPRELAYCIELVSPKLVIVEEELAGNLPSAAAENRQLIEIGTHYESCCGNIAGARRRVWPKPKTASSSSIPAAPRACRRER